MSSIQVRLDEPVSPELALVCPELAERARQLLPDPSWLAPFFEPRLRRRWDRSECSLWFARRSLSPPRRLLCSSSLSTELAPRTRFAPVPPLVEKPEREIGGESLFQKSDNRILSDLNLGGEKQSVTRRCAGLKEQPQTTSQQAFSLGRRQVLELCRSHRTPSLAAFTRRTAISAEVRLVPSLDRVVATLRPALTSPAGSASYSATP